MRAAGIVVALAIGLAGCGASPSARARTVPYTARAQQAYWTNTDRMWHHDILAGGRSLDMAVGDVAASDYESARDDFGAAHSDFARGLATLSDVRPTTKQAAFDRELRDALSQLTRGAATASGGAARQNRATITQGMRMVTLGMGHMHRIGRLLQEMLAS